jgi:hypothetical protein
MKVYELAYSLLHDPIMFYSKLEDMHYENDSLLPAETNFDQIILRAQESFVKVNTATFSKNGGIRLVDFQKSKRVLHDIFVPYSGYGLLASEKAKNALLKLYPYLGAIHFVNINEIPYYTIYSLTQENPFDFDKTLFYWAGEMVGSTTNIGNKSVPLDFIVKTEYHLDLLKKYPLFVTPYRLSNYRSSFFATGGAIATIKALGFTIEWREELEWEENPSEDFHPSRYKNASWFQGEINRHHEAKNIFKPSSPPKNTPEQIRVSIQNAIKFLAGYFPTTPLDESNQIISYISQHLNNITRTQLTDQQLKDVSLLWAEQLHRQYNWVWLEKNGTWFITHPSHEDINPIELLTDVLEKRMTAQKLSALFNTLGLMS